MCPNRKRYFTHIHMYMYQLLHLVKTMYYHVTQATRPWMKIVCMLKLSRFNFEWHWLDAATLVSYVFTYILKGEYLSVSFRNWLLLNEVNWFLLNIQISLYFVQKFIRRPGEDCYSGSWSNNESDCNCGLGRFQFPL